MNFLYWDWETVVFMVLLILYVAAWVNEHDEAHIPKWKWGRKKKWAVMMVAMILGAVLSEVWATAAEYQDLTSRCVQGDAVCRADASRTASYYGGSVFVGMGMLLGFAGAFEIGLSNLWQRYKRRSAAKQEEIAAAAARRKKIAAARKAARQRRAA